VSIEHVSRSGKSYFLHAKSGKSGKPVFFFSIDAEGPLAESIPDGYEIYENVRGQVFLRRILKRLIADEEQEELRAALRAHAEEWCFKTEVKKNTLVVYEANDNRDAIQLLVSLADPDRVKEAMILCTNYTAVLRFVLVDRARRHFNVERFCFRGSVDDWIPIRLEPPAKLAVLVKKYVKHLGKDSFYELF